ncbi:hypothetical protein [Chitinophaga silvisoli]|nr:hypothetical protein [Chitinophaga silvisoli]
MKIILFVISFLISGELATGQTSNKKIVVYMMDTASHRILIPDSTLSCHADAFACSIEIGDGRHYYGYDIRWPAPEIDGTYVLSVTEKQLYLHSCHDNPNPDFLYWFTNISPVQYRLICDVIKKNKPVFGKPFSGTLRYYTVAYRQALPDSQYTSLQNLIMLFNKALPDCEQVHLPNKDEFERTDPVQIIINENEIREEVFEERVNIPA